MKYLSFITLLCMPILLSAQSLSPTVIASYGKWSNNGGYTLSATSGEMMIETFTGGTNILTQGFQQPDEKTIGIQELNEDGLTIKIFPNPTSDLVMIDLQSENAESYGVIMYDLLGRALALPGTLDRSHTQLQQSFNLSPLPSATYFLCVVNAQGEIKNSFKIQKISY